MNLFELQAKIGIDDSGFNRGIANAKEGFGNFSAWTVAKGEMIADAIQTGARALFDFGKQALDSFADYQQLTGGVETLYGAGSKSIEEYAESVGKTADQVAEQYEMLMERQTTVFENADNAYKTAGMSANEYMETVTGFAASLTNSLGEYEWQAGHYAEMIVTDMADNANKMGTSMDMIKNAYAGFAKQNYTMLDNLKLGYGGTKTEMERLLRDAEKMAGYIEGSLDIESFADVAEAIHIVQEEMGITGTTALEASKTVSGSISTMKASWQNLLTSLGSGKNVEKTFNQLVESAETVWDNIKPVASEILTNVSELIEEELPGIVEEIPGFIADVLPELASTGGGLIESLFKGISEASPELLDFAGELITDFAQNFKTGFPDLVDSGTEMLGDFLENLTSKENLDKILSAGGDILTGIKDGVINGVDNLVDSAGEIVDNFCDYLFSDDNLPTILQSGADLVDDLGGAIERNVDKLARAAGKFVERFCDYIKEPENAKKVLAAVGDLFESAATFLLKGVGQLPSPWKESAGSERNEAYADLNKNWYKEYIFDLSDEERESIFKYDKSAEAFYNKWKDATYIPDRSGGRGGSFSSIGSVNVTVNGAGETDPDALADSIVSKITREIQGKVATTK